MLSFIKDKFAKLATIRTGCEGESATQYVAVKHKGKDDAWITLWVRKNTQDNNLIAHEHDCLILYFIRFVTIKEMAFSAINAVGGCRAQSKHFNHLKS